VEGRFLVEERERRSSLELVPEELYASSSSSSSEGWDVFGIGGHGFFVRVEI
jgi:hypothetical protein